MADVFAYITCASAAPDGSASSRFASCYTIQLSLGSEDKDEDDVISNIPGTDTKAIRVTPPTFSRDFDTIDVRELDLLLCS